MECKENEISQSTLHIIHRNQLKHDKRNDNKQKEIIDIFGGIDDMLSIVLQSNYNLSQIQINNLHNIIINPHKQPQTKMSNKRSQDDEGRIRTHKSRRKIQHGKQHNRRKRKYRYESESDFSNNSDNSDNSDGSYISDRKHRRKRQKTTYSQFESLFKIAIKESKPIIVIVNKGGTYVKNVNEGGLYINKVNEG
eukprot:843427_1